MNISIKKITNVLETSSSVFSLIALVAIFALPVLVSLSISATVSDNNLAYDTVPRIVLIDTLGQTNTNYSANKYGDSIGDVLGVFTQRKPSLSDQLSLNNNLSNVFVNRYIQKLGLQNYNSEFYYKGDLAKTNLLQITNTFDKPLEYGIKISYDLINTKSKEITNSFRKFYISNEEYLLSNPNNPFYTKLTLMPGQSVVLYIELKNTLDTKYTLEINEVNN